VNDIVAIFSPAESADTWTLRVTSNYPALRLSELDLGSHAARLRRPNFDDLNARMLRAHGGFVWRVRPGGEIEISASERSAMVLHQWLSSIIHETKER
jgi:hypothetical protein